jgi:hypothetical protein
VRSLCLALASLTACAAAPPALPTHGTDGPAARAAAEQHYTLWWHGARIGSAVERRHQRAGVLVRLERREHLLVRRGDAVAAIDLRLAIAIDGDLQARTIELETRDGAAIVRGRADRDGGRWRIDVAGEPPRLIAGDAVPAELVPDRVHRDGHFDGPVLLAGRGFAVAAGAVAATGDGRYRAVLHTAAGDLVSTLRLDPDGAVASIAGDDGVVQRRASAAEAAAPFAPAEVIAAGAIAVVGAAAPDDGPLAVTLAPVDRAPPPAMPGQSLTVDGDGWRLSLASRGAASAPIGPIAALVRAVAADVVDDLGASALAPGADRGDCTAHAVAFVRRAADAGIEAHVVTGYRVDGDRLVRHRWALARAGATWIAVDPSHGEAPAAPRLIGLAVHGSSAAELALADAAFSGLARATATVAPLAQ